MKYLQTFIPRNIQPKKNRQMCNETPICVFNNFVLKQLSPRHRAIGLLWCNGSVLQRLRERFCIIPFYLQPEWRWFNREYPRRFHGLISKWGKLKSKCFLVKKQSIWYKLYMVGCGRLKDDLKASLLSMNAKENPLPAGMMSNRNDIPEKYFLKTCKFTNLMVVSQHFIRTYFLTVSFGSRS